MAPNFSHDLYAVSGFLSSLPAFDIEQYDEFVNTCCVCSTIFITLAMMVHRRDVFNFRELCPPPYARYTVLSNPALTRWYDTPLALGVFFSFLWLGLHYYAQVWFHYGMCLITQPPNCSYACKYAVHHLFTATLVASCMLFRLYGFWTLAVLWVHGLVHIANVTSRGGHAISVVFCHWYSAVSILLFAYGVLGAQLLRKGVHFVSDAPSKRAVTLRLRRGYLVAASSLFFVAFNNARTVGMLSMCSFSTKTDHSSVLFQHTATVHIVAAIAVLVLYIRYTS